MSSKDNSLFLIVILLIILTACGPTSSPEPVVETMVVTEAIKATPVEVIQVVTPTPERTGLRTLVICLDEEPQPLQLFTGPFSRGVLEQAIFDGPIDNNSYAFQGVIFEKVPSLADGDATLTKVTVSEGDIVVDSFEEVVTLDPDADPPIMLTPASGGEAVPYEGGDFEVEQLSATFRLLPDLKWSDGAPLTAADLVYTYELEADDSGLTDTFKAIDDVTIQRTWTPGGWGYDYFTWIPRPTPGHIWSQYSPPELLEAENSFLYEIGWGPYMLDEWIEGESISLHKNPHYFRAEEGLPKFDRVILRFTSDNANANIAALLVGECDLVTAPLDDQIELLLELHQAGKLKATFSTGTVWEHLDFGIQHVDYDNGYQIGVDRPDFFSDVRTRQAFAMCMDRQAVVDSIFYGQSLVPNGYVHPQHSLYNPDILLYDFDVAAGSALLEQVGWLDDDGDPGTPRIARSVPNVPDGTPLEVAYETTSSQTRQQVTAIIKDSLAQCGIKANIQLYDDSEWFDDVTPGKLFGRRYDLGQFAWDGGNVPPCYLYMIQGTPGTEGATWISIQDGLQRTFPEVGWDGPNNTGFANYEYDRVCGAALRVLPGQFEYEAAHLEAQRIFAEQLPSVPLYFWIKVTAMRPDMCGVIVDPTASDEFWNIEEFDYGEGCEN